MNHLKTGNAFYGQGSYKNYKFLGKELQETGFYDMGARFYMPDLGIFGQHDPLSAATLDPYGYAYNNPMFFSDPTGLYGAQVNKKGELPATSPGGADNPLDVGEVVLNAPIRAMASAIPSNCSYCYVGNGRKLVSQLNLPALRPISANINASNFNKYFPPVLHNGSAYMMNSMWDAAAIALTNNIEPDNELAVVTVAFAAILITRSPSFARAGGWLAYHEAPTLGHTLARHVAKTDADLISRLAIQRGITGASSFTSETVAETVISSTISTNRGAIKSWLNSGATTNLRLDYTGSTNIGRGILRRTGIVNDLTNARIVLKPKGNGSYFLLTAFPQ